MKKLTMFVVSMFFLTSATLIRASEPVPGAEITVEQVPGPVVVKNCVTDANGVFSFTVADIESAGKLPDKHGHLQAIKLLKPGDQINLLMIITPPAGFESTSNQVTITVTVTSQTQRFGFGVTFKRKGKTNKGSFAINPKAQT